MSSVQIVIPASVYGNSVRMVGPGDVSDDRELYTGIYLKFGSLRSCENIKESFVRLNPSVRKIENVVPALTDWKIATIHSGIL